MAGDRWRQLQLPSLSEELPISTENALTLLVKALEEGRVHVTEHFKMRSRERDFTTVDVEQAIRQGHLLSEPSFCPDFETWVFRLHWKCENRLLEIRVALDFKEDLSSPLIVYLTGIARGKGTKSTFAFRESQQ